MSTANIPGAFDCDTHCYEPRDAVTRYLPKKYPDRAIRADARTPTARTWCSPGTAIATFNSEEGIGFDYAYIARLAQADAQGDGVGQSRTPSYQPEPMRPEYLEREPRL